jgi:NADPH2:quinone reductase
MQAISVQQFGGPEVLTLAEVPTPEPGDGQVRVDLAAAGVNFIDVYHRIGRYPRDLPLVLGAEGAGIVSAVGPGVEGVSVGDRVASVDFQGSYAASALVAADRVVPVPVEIELETAAAAMLQGMTAHYLLLETHPVRAGETVLVHAAAGGMGLLLTQLASKFGAHVVGTTSTLDKERLAREAGAEHVIRYTEADIVTEVRRITDGAGVAAVYDGVGKDTFDASLASLRSRGILVLYGASSGPVPPFDPIRLMQAGSAFLTRPMLFHYIVEREELLRRANDLFGWISKGDLSIRVHKRYQLADAAQAHTDLEARKTTGKLLLIP